jgi:methanogenic corrinoid protein MtbC1
LAALFDSLVTESMHRIGDMWLNGTVTVADEHLASGVLLRALQKLRAVVVRQEPVGAMAICCAIEGELHEIPVHLAEVVLEAQGWQTINLGPNTPLPALRDMATRYKPDLICIAARAIADLDRATSDYAQLRKVTEKPGTKLVVGGEGFRDRAIRKRFPADFYGTDFTGFSKFVNTLITS